MTKLQDGLSVQNEGTTDVHSHLLPRAYVERLTALARDDGALGKTRDAASVKGMSRLPSSCSKYMLGDLQSRLKIMDRARVGHQVLSPGSALAFPKEVRARGELVSAWNDAVHDEIAESGRPEAFSVFAALPLPDVFLAIEEVFRVGSRSTTAGFAVNSHILGESLASDKWRPVFEVLNQYRFTVFVHPHRFRVSSLLDPYLEVDAGTQFEDTIVSLDIGSNRFGKLYPNIRWIVPHLGGTLPFLLDRLDEHWHRDKRWRSDGQPPSDSLSNVWFDSAGHGEASLRFAIGRLGSDRILFGTDFPMLGRRSFEASVQALQDVAGSDRSLSAILSDNASAILGAHVNVGESG